MVSDENNKKESYTAKDIYVLEGLEPVRKRPAMYIGSTDSKGLHHLVWEALDNSVDEAMAGYAKNISVVLLPENKVMVVDDGRGIPVDIHPQTKKSALETVICTLHAGGKFGGESYKVSGGLHGVGISVVNALSKFMEARICRDGQEWVQQYSKGKAQSTVKKTGKCSGSGTSILFEADSEIFKDIEYDFGAISRRIREQAYLTPGLKITASDKREENQLLHHSQTFYFEGGISSYVRHLNHNAKPLNPTIFYVKKEENGIQVEVALQYIDEFGLREISFANNIHTPDGGSHLTGFHSGLTRILNDYARKNKFFKEGEEGLTGDDTREGLTAVISVKLREPQFEGQTKARLGTSEARGAVEAVFSEAFGAFLEEHPEEAKTIIERVLLVLEARKAARAAKETILRKGILEGLSLPGKLADCQTRKPEEAELFIVEGESAGGCFSGDTKIALANGKFLSFKELIEENKKGIKNYCYTIKSDGEIGISLIKNPRRTRNNVEVVKIILDNNEEIICTPDHRFMLRDGSYKEAKDLISRDSLMPFRKKFSQIGGRITIEGYEMVLSPKNNYWIFTHLLADEYNLQKKIYSREQGNTIHHLDFNKLNNNPDNLIRMIKEEHLLYHTKFLKNTLHRPEMKEKARRAHQTKEYLEKIKKIMNSPGMKKILSERAKKQWQNKEYKDYMARKFLEFYQNNSEYREKNNKILCENQKKYWGNEENRIKQAEKVCEYFKNNPEKRIEFRENALKQWSSLTLRKWRSQKTKEQWTPEFRRTRKESYNKTYLDKALPLLKEIYEQTGELNFELYNQKRKQINDKSIIKISTICERFFNGDESQLKEAVVNYNHKIKKITSLKEKIDVYDLEAEETHNFALASGVFVHNSSKMARDRKIQAILPLKGKILNVERARIDKMLSSEEIKALIIALGTAVAKDFNLEKLRYHKIVIATDADVDGAHIKTLLLTLFYRYFQPVIEGGYLYIATPPLYRIQKGKAISYAYSDQEKEKILKELKENYSIQRYKGLGEMNAEQLWETTMDPSRRILKKIAIEDAEEASKIFDILMGSEVEPRKLFIQTRAKAVQNLDV